MGQAPNIQVAARITAAERRRIIRAAKINNQTVSDFVRGAVFAAVKCAMAKRGEAA